MTTKKPSNNLRDRPAPKQPHLKPTQPPPRTRKERDPIAPLPKAEYDRRRWTGR